MLGTVPPSAAPMTCKHLWLTDWLTLTLTLNLTWPTLTTANKGPVGHFKDKAEDEDDNEDAYGDDDNVNDAGGSTLANKKVEWSPVREISMYTENRAAFLVPDLGASSLTHFD